LGRTSTGIGGGGGDGGYNGGLRGEVKGEVGGKNGGGKLGLGSSIEPKIGFELYGMSGG
tara:strand:- start:8885 stop:9061 length:177 start_codon:yes stop_codon:yes gene_type:complete